MNSSQTRMNSSQTRINSSQAEIRLGPKGDYSYQPKVDLLAEIQLEIEFLCNQDIGETI